MKNFTKTIIVVLFASFAFTACADFDTQPILEPNETIQETPQNLKSTTESEEEDEEGGDISTGG